MGVGDFGDEPWRGVPSVLDGSEGKFVLGHPEASGPSTGNGVGFGSEGLLFEREWAMGCQGWRRRRPASTPACSRDQGLPGVGVCWVDGS